MYRIFDLVLNSKIPIFRLSCPRQHSLLADVRRAVEAALNDNGIR